MAPGGNGAHLGEQACPIYRPDIEGIAYWEFEIAGLKETQPREHDGPSSDVGFILASTGRHDVPIPHWSLTIEPPSRALEAKSKDGEVARIIKLDTLAYVAEDTKGESLSILGQIPLRIVGMRGGLTKFRGISTVTAAPREASTDDDSPTELIVKQGGVKVPELKLAAWKSWTDLKRGYSRAYKPHLEALVASSAEAWTIEDLIDKFGEGIYEGQQLTVPLLKPGEVRVSGDGAKLVELIVLDDRQSPAVTLKALSSREKKEANFQLEISYSDGTSEILLFFVVPEDTPSNNRSVLPHFTIKSEGGIIS